MDTNHYVVIMAGGIGSRFWPYSRNDHPKQFLDILGIGKSLLQLTYDRFINICQPENIYIVTNENYKDLVKQQIPELASDQLLLEPIRRNTAPCIAYACYKINKINPQAMVVVSPSDHAIFNNRLFFSAVKKALMVAQQEGKLVTLGITPKRPETGYGYIQYIPDKEKDYKRVKTFTEKPQIELAKKFIESGDFVWNAGIFIWSIEAILKAFEKHLADIAEVFEEGNKVYFTKKEKAFIKIAYSQSRNISIDYGIMEKAEDVLVVPGEFGWSDLGSWQSMHEQKSKDKSLNVVDANAILYDCKDSLIKGPDDQLIVVQGLEGYLVASCDNVLLICKKDDEQKFREFVKEVKAKKGEEYL